MVAFLIRRLFGMILVLIAVSFVTYLIFFKIPGGDPAIRIAGRTATQANITNIRHQLGLDQNIFVQWWDMMKQLLSGQLISYYDGTNVVQQIKEGMPATFSLCIGAAIIWLFFGILVGTISAVSSRALLGPGHHDARAGRHLAAGRVARTDHALPLRRGRGHDRVPGRRLRAADPGSRRSGSPTS